MQFKNINFHPEQNESELHDFPIGCPKCGGLLVKHLVWEQTGCRVYSYHCRDHGDVVPVVKD